MLFFAFKPKMSSISLKGLVLDVPRQDLTVTTAAGALATLVSFQFGDGSSFQLDSNRNIGQYQRLNDGLLVALGARALPS